MLTSKQERALARYTKQTPAEEVAYAAVSDKMLNPGPYRMLPLMACVQQDESGPLPFLFVYAVVMRNYGTSQHGGFNWRIPLNERTIPNVVRLLGVLGWDARVWPAEKGWPDGDATEADGLRFCMDNAKLGATFVFPPDPERGSRVATFLLSRSRGQTFVLPVESVLPEDAEVRPELEARLRDLIQTPDVFRFVPFTAPNAEQTTNQ